MDASLGPCWQTLKGKVRILRRNVTGGGYYKSPKVRKINEFVRDQLTTLVVHQEPLLAPMKRRKLAWYGHTVCNDGLS